MSSSPFTAKKLNSSTFAITEEDAYGEFPIIYVKVYPKAPVLVVGDTGCDRASKHTRFQHLRQYLEQRPLPCNNDSPLNPHGSRQYLLIISHCHSDHTLGIPQFLRGGQTSIVASAAGRDFIESDLAGNGLYKPIGEPVQPWKVTHWAQAFENLTLPLKPGDEEPVNLGIMIIQTPGHTPDELAWYDRHEMHLYVGDSFYERGAMGMDIIWPSQGNLVEWYYSMQKLRCFVRSENSRIASDFDQPEDQDGWVRLFRRVTLGCGHQTTDADGEDILEDLERTWWRLLRGGIPLVETRMIDGELVDRWMEHGGKGRFSFRAPRRLMEGAKVFFDNDPALQ